MQGGSLAATPRESACSPASMSIAPIGYPGPYRPDTHNSKHQQGYVEHAIPWRHQPAVGQRVDQPDDVQRSYSEGQCNQHPARRNERAAAMPAQLRRGVDMHRCPRKAHKANSQDHHDNCHPNPRHCRFLSEFSMYGFTVIISYFCLFTKRFWFIAP